MARRAAMADDQICLDEGIARFILIACIIAAILAIPVCASAAVPKMVGEEDHKGLGPHFAVPAWAKHTSVHFMPWVEPHSHAQTKRIAEPSQTVEGEAPLFYFGGLGVQHNPHIYPIFWGSNWNKEPGLAVRTQVMEMYRGLTGSAYQELLTQYFDSTGRISPTVEVSPPKPGETPYTDTSTSAPSEVTSESIREEADRAISTNKWPTVFNDQFVVLPAPGSTYVLTGYCAYHEYNYPNGPGEEIGNMVSLSFVPYEGDPPLAEHCLSRDPEENVGHITASSAAHEYAESATDPGAEIATGTWRGNTNEHEIADMCNSTDAELPNGTYAQPLWDDHQSACSISDEKPPHVWGVTEAATEVGPTTATLHGVVNPEGPETKYQFEYDTKEYRSGEGSHGTKVPASLTVAGTGVANIAVSYKLGGLPHGTIYHYRVVATNSSGITYGEDRPFTTLLTPPVVETTTATNLAPTTATLNGTVNPNGLSTNYYFIYSTNSSQVQFGTGTKTSEKNVGAGTSTLEATQPISGLSHGTEYFFKLVAINSEGTSNGKIHSFITTGPPVNLTVPEISPTTPYQGEQATTTSGTWTREPTSYAYQWERCNTSGAECTAISGATKATYTPVEADVGHKLRSVVTASNSEGAGSPATSFASSMVNPPPRVVKTLRFLSGGASPSIAAGPDGSLWATEEISYGKEGMIYKFKPSEYTRYFTPAGTSPWRIAPGPKGESALWFTDNSRGRIGRITTSGAIIEYPLERSESGPNAITAGPDGNMWFTEGGPAPDKIGKITPAGVITEYALPEKNTTLVSVTPGTASEAKVWFADTYYSKIGKISTSGAVTEYSLPKESGPSSIVLGPSSRMWFTEKRANKIGSISVLGGAITEYALPPESHPDEITLGPDGDLWFVDQGTHKLGKVTTSGTITEYSLSFEGFAVLPEHLSWASDGNLGFSGWGNPGLGVMAGEIAP